MPGIITSVAVPTTTTTTSPAAPAEAVSEAPAAPAEAAAPAAPAEPKTPEQLAADKIAADAVAAKVAKIAELRGIARATAEARRAKEALRERDHSLRQLEQTRGQDIERAKRADELEAALKDPEKLWALAQKNGTTARAVAERILKEGTPEELQARLEQRAAEIADARLAEWEKKQSERQAEQYRAAAEQQFAAAVKAAPEQYPVAAVMLEAMPDYVMYHARRITAVAQDANSKLPPGEKPYDDEDVKKALDNWLAPMHARLSRPNSTQAATVGAPMGTGKAATAGAATRAPSVTNAVASAPGSLPADFDSMSREKQEEFFKQMLRERLAGRAT